MPPRKEEPDRRCRRCDAHLVRKRFNGRLEDLGVFVKRRYCDRRCMAEEMVQESISHQGYLFRARRFRKTACEECATTDRLHVHHIDGDFRNNDPSNLRTLCSSCHLKTHWANGRWHQPHRRSVLAEPFAELLAVCEEALAAIPDPEIAFRLEAAMLAVRPGHH